MKKNNRQRLIKQLISDNEIDTQDELIKLLSDFDVIATQATISRDIRELRIIKEHSDSGKSKYVIFSKDDSYSMLNKLERSLKDSLIKIECINFVVILHTDPKGADVITNYLDEVNFDEIAGTIAGFDTIFIISYNEDTAKIIMDKIKIMANI